MHISVPRLLSGPQNLKKPFAVAIVDTLFVLVCASILTQLDMEVIRDLNSTL